MAQANILIGMGGTGAEILTHLAGLLAQDGKWKSMAGTDLYFLLVDTDQGALKDYGSRIRSTLPDAYLDTVHLSESYATLTPLIAEWSARIQALGKKDAAKARRALKRFSEHWWFTDPDNPSFDQGVFKAETVDDLTSGAGQVPAIGFLLAWHQLDKVSSAYERLFEDAVARRGDSLRANNANSFFFGSLAGGTGRGILIPLAFRYKMDFHRRFGQALPLTSLYTFDSSCFEPVREDYEALPQMMNALSGASELSCWSDLHEQQNHLDESLVKLLYRLPGESEPHDPNYDVVHFDGLAEGGQRDIRQMAGDAVKPFNAVSLTFRRSSRTITDHPSQLYEMVAAALYVRLSRAEVDGRLVNMGRRLLSIGSSTCRVDEAAIERHFRNKARFECLARLLKPAEDSALKELADQRADEIIEAQFGASDARRALVIDDWGVGGESSADSGSVLETTARLLFEGEAMGADALATLVDALEKDDYRKALNVVKDRFDLESLSDDPEFAKESNKIFARAIETYARTYPGCGFHDFDTWMEGFISRLVGDASLQDQSSILEQDGSTRLMAECADQLLRRLDRLAADLSVAEVESASDWSLPDLATELAKRKGREAVVVGARFNERERHELSQLARGFLRFAFAQVFGAMCANDAGPFGPLRQRLRVLRNNGLAVSSAADKLLQELDVKSLEEEHARIFVRRRKDGKVDSRELENAIAEYDNPERFIYRTLKPLEPTEADGIVLHSGPVAEEVRTVLLGDEIPEDKREAKKNPELCSVLEEAVARNVRYVYINREADNRVERRVIDRFELHRVLHDLRDAWLDHFETKIGADGFHALCQKYENYFGITPRLSPNKDTVFLDGPARAGDAGLVLSMASSLARTTAPYWQLYADKRDAPRVICMLPIAAHDGNQMGAWRQAVRLALKDKDARFDLVDNKTVRDQNNVEVRHNPFMISCYVSEGCQNFEEIRSLNYWENNAQLRSVMTRMEDPKLIPVVFATSRSRNAPDEYEALFDGYRGSGFADSCYLQNPLLRRLRWRPWYPDHETEWNSGHLESMAWLALYGIHGPAFFLAGSDCEQRATEVMNSWNWPAESVLQKGSRENIQLRRMPGAAEGYPENPVFSEKVAGIAYKIGSRIDQSLGNLVKVFTDEKEPRDGTRESAIALRQGLEDEFTDFLDRVGKQAGFNPQLNPQTFIQILQGVRGRINDLIKATPAGADHDREALEAALKHGQRLEESSRIQMGE